MKRHLIGWVAISALTFLHCSDQGKAAPPSAGGEDAGEPGAEADAAGEDLGPVPGLASAWGVHDGARVEKDDLSHPAESGNTAWRDGAVRVFGARNEVVAFQLIVESDQAGITDLEVSLPALTRRGGGPSLEYAAPGEDPTDYVGRPIQIFTEHYMQVDEPSRAGWIFDPDGPEAPGDPTGLKPVQLVPENAAEGRGGLPIDVPPGQNQALWFDIYIPRGLPAGTYDGEIRLTAGGGARDIPVELEVFPFELPEENSLTAMLYFEPQQVVRYQGRDLQERYHRFAHRNRVELVHRYTAATLEDAAGRFDGSDFTAQHGYAGPGTGTGNTIAPASFYGPGSAYDDPASARQASDAWMAALADSAPDARTFLYMPDEPGPSQYGRIWTIADNVHSNPGPGSALPIFATTGYTSGLDGAIDIWCAQAGTFRPSHAEQERAKGRRYWFYNGTRPATGALVIDAPATDARVNAWAAFKHDVEVYFYWHAVHWRHNFQKVGERDQDVWANTITFDNRGQPNKPVGHQGFIHGDGVLIYPGEEVLHPAEDRGIAGPVSSLRLANLRRGLQDHLYLTLAEREGLEAEVDAALEAVVPAVFSEAGPSVEFAEDGDAFEAARRALAEAITAAP